MTPTRSQRSGIDERAERLPPELVPLFDDAFIRSCDLYEEYVGRCAEEVAASSGLLDACARPATVEEAIDRAGLAPEVARAPVSWLLRTLTARGTMDVDRDAAGAERYAARAARTGAPPEEVAEAQASRDTRCLPSYRIAAIAAAAYPAVLRGEIPGERALFAADHLSAWADYFSNANPLYAVANAIAAMAAGRALEARPGAVLEIGGGFGSGAAALLDRIAATGTPVSTYRFTEVSFPFLRRGQRALAARDEGPALVFARLDMDRPFAEAGIDEGAYAAVYAVNALHVARDLTGTLAEIRRALAPGGALVLGECIRPFPGRPVYVEFVFQLLGSFREPVLHPTWRPNGGFLTPEQWAAALAANGFADVEIYPDIARIRDDYPSLVTAAVTARRA